MKKLFLMQKAMTSHGDLVDNKNLAYHYMGDFDEEMLKVIKSVKDFQATPIQEIWHNDGDQVLAYERKDLIFVFNFNPKQSFTDYVRSVVMALPMILWFTSRLPILCIRKKRKNG